MLSVDSILNHTFLGFNPNLIDHEPRNLTGSDETERSPEEDRRLRRMKSNRESARRSRMRKQRHLEELRLEASRLQAENRELTNRLDSLSQHFILFRRENNLLRAEAAVLRRRIDDIRRFLLLRQIERLSSPAPGGGFACSGFASGSAQTGSSIVA